MHQFDGKNSTCPLCAADERFADAISVAHTEAPLKQAGYMPQPKTRKQPVSVQQSNAPHRPVLQATVQTNKKPKYKLLLVATAVVAAAIILAGPILGFFGWQGVARDIIEFGGYDWRVLDVQGNRMLIITDRVIDRRMYHHTFEAVTWETSDIRRYLNIDFFNRFSPQDQARIANTTVINNDNQWFGTRGGDNTTDRIFLLSIEEVVRYFGDSGQLGNRPGGATWIRDEYSSARIARNQRDSASWWWLRSPGNRPNGAASVDDHGSLDMNGRNVFWEGGGGGGVRPALWLYL